MLGPSEVRAWLSRYDAGRDSTSWAPPWPAGTSREMRRRADLLHDRRGRYPQKPMRLVLTRTPRAFGAVTQLRRGL